MRIQTIIGVKGNKRYSLALSDVSIVDQYKQIKDAKISRGLVKIGKEDVQLDAIEVFETARTIKFKALPKPVEAAPKKK